MGVKGGNPRDAQLVQSGIPRASSSLIPHPSSLFALPPVPPSPSTFFPRRGRSRRGRRSGEITCCPPAIAMAARGTGSSRRPGRIAFPESDGGKPTLVNIFDASSMMEAWSGSITTPAPMDGTCTDGGIELMDIYTILVPYDSGHRGARMGRGPLHFGKHGVSHRLRAGGHQVSEVTIDVPAAFPTEVGTSFAVYRSLSEQVRAVVAGGSFPIVLAGNCGSSLGTVSGVRAASPNDHSADDSPIGVIWLDAHADFNTPETTTSGFLDGTVLAALTGRGWGALTASIPGFRPVPDRKSVV